MSNPSGSQPWWDGDFVWRPDGEASSPEPRTPERTPTHLPPSREPSEPVRRPPSRDVTCWRCGKDVEEDWVNCPYCRASLGPERPRRRRDAERLPPLGDDDGVMPMIWFFVGLLGVSLLGGIVAISLAQRGGVSYGVQMALTLFVEAVMTLLVVIAVFVLPRPPEPPKISPAMQGLTWGLAAPLLVVMLGLNFLYHELLRKMMGPGIDDITFGMDKLSPLIILMICVQPAIVEELFFRHLALGLLRKQMGIHGGVLVSSIMFAVAHIGAPLSMPILGMIGMGFGYVRIYSRNLVLPMLLHFLHNFAVIMLVVK